MRIHITGGPGSGKTTLSKRIAPALALPRYELDAMALDLEAHGQPFAMMANEAVRIAQQERWLSDGSYMGWAEPLFERADLVVWLDIPWRVASYRIIARHIRATFAGNNRFPGWRRLYSFWCWSQRYYTNNAGPGLNAYGVPMTKQTAAMLLKPFSHKLVVCRSDKEIHTLYAGRLGIVDT